MSKRKPEPERVTMCLWFALCDRPATGVTPHPVLGYVPTCDRCASFASNEKGQPQ